ncbi:MAG: hypothetical protein M1832_004113 [Thelocarpon impressellum]|nr:MAG: hypothetical protein M1832_004113 [Thelocarpon impressellum]
MAPAPTKYDSEGEHAMCRGNDGYAKGEPYITGISEYPVTIERKVFVPSRDSLLCDPGTARATYAPTTEKPYGTTEDDWARKHQHQTVVVQHTEYFDRDNDGVIWPQDTYQGCRDFGWNVFLSLLATVLINGALSYPTMPTVLPDPFFRIFVSRMHKNKHGSDSMTYDNEGRFRPQQYEDFFAKYDRDGKGGLSKMDLWDAWKGQRLVFDLFGWSASFLEWLATYLLIWPEDGILRKEDVRGVFDGSIFYKKAEETKRKRSAANGVQQGVNGLEKKKST